MCTVCGFKSNNQQGSQHLLSDQQKTSKQTDLITYSNPNLSIDNNFVNIDARLKEQWTNCSSSTLNRQMNKLANSTNCRFASATLPIKKKSNISSAYIPISECHTGKPISNEQCTNGKKSIKDNLNNQIVNLFDNYDGDYNLKTNNQKFSDSNKENKFNNNLNYVNKNKNLLDCSLNSTHDGLLSLDNNRSSPNLSFDDVNYDIPRKIKDYKKNKIKDLLNIVPSPPKEEEILYANAKSLPRFKNYNNNNKKLDQNNYLNVNDERPASLNEREYYNNINERLNLTLAPPRPPKPIAIGSKQKSSSLNLLNDLTEFDPLNSVPKASIQIAISPDLMYSIPKTQVELEFEKQLKNGNSSSNVATKNCDNTSLDTIIPITHSSRSDEEKNELHRYTNAATNVFSKSIDGQSLILDYEKPTLPCNNNLNDLESLHQFKTIPTFKLNDKIEPMTPSLIVTSTPLFSDPLERHFNFNDQYDILNKPQVNRDLKPKKSDTSIESFLMLTNKSPNKNSDHHSSLINRTNLSSSFNSKLRYVLFKLQFINR